MPNAPQPNDTVIIAATRTAIGEFLGTLSGHSAAQLGALVIKEALARGKVEATQVHDVIMGQVLTAGVGQNPARQAAIGAGLPHSVPGITINRVCGSGLQAVMWADALLQTGQATYVVAGGQESMSGSPHALALRTPTKMGNANMIDTMITDGLWDCFGNTHMGITAENVAKDFNISRDAQDVFAHESQRRAADAIQAGRFKNEITPVVIPQKKGDALVFDTDEHPRLSPVDALAKLRPAFDPAGSVTAGNASGLNDGAAALVLTTRARAEAAGQRILARVVSHAVAGVPPHIMGTGPIPASKLALEKAGWSVHDLDLIEANEAFAAQALAVMQGLNLPSEKTNVWGGAIALGHPIGASGARVLTTLIHALHHHGLKRGLATLCIGGGMGVALCVQAE